VKTGLVSITFRQLSPEDIIQLCVDNQLDGIEWGGDVHVPPGNAAVAARVRSLTEQAGLGVAAYGSYYVLNGSATNNKHTFDAVLDSAQALGAPLIRIWAGAKSSAQATAQDWADAIKDSRRLGDMAAAKGVKVAYEYHQGTLTDTNESAMKLLTEVAHPNVTSFWQPPNGADFEYCCEGLGNLLMSGRLTSIHAFHWWPGFKDRHPLAAGAARWQPYLSLVREYDQTVAQNAAKEQPCPRPDALVPERYVCLEFVKNDDPENLVVDAKTLNQWLSELTENQEHKNL